MGVEPGSRPLDEPVELEKSTSIAAMNSYNVVALTNPAHQAGRYYQRTGFYAEAERLFRTVFEIRQKVLGDRDNSTLDVRNDLAGVLQDRGKPKDSIDEYRAVLEIRMVDPGPTRPETLATRHGIAEALRDQGNYTAAESEYREIVRLRVEKNHFEEHSDTLDSRQNLGFLLHLSGRYTDSKEEYRRVLAAYHQKSIYVGFRPCTISAACSRTWATIKVRGRASLRRSISGGPLSAPRTGTL